jgi:predicted metalloprotease with PDZ domain
LEYQIEALQRELKNHMSSRSVDDIMDELWQTKAELRRIAWKRWLPWSR